MVQVITLPRRNDGVSFPALPCTQKMKSTCGAIPMTNFRQEFLCVSCYQGSSVTPQAQIPSPGQTPVDVEPSIPARTAAVPQWEQTPDKAQVCPAAPGQ